MPGYLPGDKGILDSAFLDPGHMGRLLAGTLGRREDGNGDVHREEENRGIEAEDVNPGYEARGGREPEGTRPQPQVRASSPG